MSRPGRVAALPTVALAVPVLHAHGGVTAVARFLHRAIEESGRYRATLVSLASSSRDRASTRLARPATWPRGVRALAETWEGHPVTHVGAAIVELETQRYRPRRLLTDLFDAHDVVQVVAGAPAWANVARDTRTPVALQVATLVGVERAERLARERGPRRVWRAAMTRAGARIEHAALAHVDAAFVENRWMLEELRRRMPPERVHFAPPGVDADTFTPAAVLARDGPILSVGRFGDPRKDLPTLFRAYARLRETLPDAPPLLLAGREGPRDVDRAVARDLGIADHVDIRTDLSFADLVAAFRSARLFVMSSREEGLGVAILEAMACGLPVVSTNSGGPSTTVADGETGFLTPVGDPDALAVRMRDLVLDPPRAAAMGAAGRRRVEHAFSLAVAGARFLDTYDALLAERPTRAEMRAARAAAR